MGRTRYNSEGIKFTRHAREQMDRRGVEPKDVFDTMNNPDSVYPGKRGTTVFQKAATCGKFVFKVVANIVMIPIVIITTYKSYKNDQ